jgi:hypothetical protein
MGKRQEKALAVAGFKAAAERHLEKAAALDAEALKLGERLAVLDSLARQAMRNYLDRGVIFEAYYHESVKAKHESVAVREKYYAATSAASHERFLASHKRDLAWRLENEYAYRPGSKGLKQRRRRERHMARREGMAETANFKTSRVALDAAEQLIALPPRAEPTTLLCPETDAEQAAWAVYQAERFVSTLPLETYDASEPAAKYVPDSEVLALFETA